MNEAMVSKTEAKDSITQNDCHFIYKYWKVVCMVLHNHPVLLHFMIVCVCFASKKESTLEIRCKSHRTGQEGKRKLFAFVEFGGEISQASKNPY